VGILIGHMNVFSDPINFKVTKKRWGTYRLKETGERKQCATLAWFRYLNRIIQVQAIHLCTSGENWLNIW
jgi:hypothetical protein